MLHLPDTELKQTRFYQEVFAEGLEEGIEKGQLNLLLRQLSYRLGPLGATRTDRIRTLPGASRDTLAEALFDFTSAADLDAWLDANALSPG
jgi:predicted transposase YdaD